MNVFDKSAILSIIKKDNFSELQDYVKAKKINLREFKSNVFDILIYSIENDASIPFITLLLNHFHYKNLNYTFKEVEEGDRVSISDESLSEEYSLYKKYKVPLFLALNYERFDLAHLLLRQNADINYRFWTDTGQEINIFQYLLHINGNIFSFNNKIIKNILKSGLYLKGISSELIINSIQEYRNDALEFIFKHYIYDNTFILYLLNFCKNKVAFTDQQLQDIINKEKGKIEVNDTLYAASIESGNCNAVNILLNYDTGTKETIVDRIKQYNIFEIAVRENNYALVKKILDYDIYITEVDNLRSFIIDAVETNSFDILKLLVESLLKNITLVPHDIDFEKVFLVASRRNNQGIMKYLIEVLLNISSKAVDCLDLTSLKKYDHRFLILIINIAIKIRDFKLIKSIMESDEFKHRVNINDKDKNDECPIVTAFDDMTYYADDIEIFDYLLKHGGSGNVLKDQYGRFLFYSAINYRKYMAATCFLKQNFIIDDQNLQEDYHPLLKAVYHNQLDQVKEIIHEESYQMDIMMNVAINFPIYGFTPLILSYLLNHTPIYEFLLDHCDIDELDSNGYSILHYAILKEDLDAIVKLIERGADVNFKENKNGRGNSAFDIAICIRNKEIFKVLLSSPSLQLNKTNEWGITPIMTIIDIDHYPMEDKMEIIEGLIEHGSDINFTDFFGHSPLTRAIQKQSLPIIKILIEHGANVNYIIQERNYTLNSKNKSLWMYAIELGDLEIVKYLIECPADIDFDYGRDFSDLIGTIEKNGRKEILDFLIQNNDNTFTMGLVEEIILLNKLDLLRHLISYSHTLDVNQTDSQGNGPLAYAIEHSQKLIANYLIDQGADLHHVNHCGESIEKLCSRALEQCSQRGDYFRESSSFSIYKRIKRLLSKDSNTNKE